MSNTHHTVDSAVSLRFVSFAERRNWSPDLQYAMANADVSSQLAALLVVNELHKNLRHELAYAGKLSGLTLACSLARKACEALTRHEKLRKTMESGTVEASLLIAFQLVHMVDERVGF